MKKIELNSENIKRFMAFITAATLVTTGVVGCSNSKKNENGTLDLSSVTDEQLKNLTFDELMEYLQDGMKKENVQTVYDFLDNFNGNLADSLKLDGDGDKKFQITWDTAIAMRLGYNQYSATEMYEMYDEYDLNAEALYKLVKGYTTMAIPAYLRLTNNTGIATLIDDKDAQDFYLKYENKLIEMNKARFTYLETGDSSDKSTFENKAKEFNQMIRDDFLNDSGEVSFGSLDDAYATGSYASVVPLISASMEITRNTSSKLTDAEVEELNLDGYCNTIETNIKDNVEKLQTMQAMKAMDDVTGTTESTTGEKEEETQTVTTIDIKYEILREAAIEDLKKNEHYFRSNELSTLPVTDFNKDVASTLTSQSQAYTKAYANSTKRGKTTTKKYNSRSDLAKDYPDLVDDAKKQEDAISEKYSKENEENKNKAQSEANSKASQKSSENESKADQEIQDKNTTAEVKDNSGNTYDYTVTQKSNVGDVVIDDNHTTTNNSGDSDKNFDGPIYDADGNIIAGKMGILDSITNTVNNIESVAKVLIKSR